MESQRALLLGARGKFGISLTAALLAVDTDGAGASFAKKISNGTVGCVVRKSTHPYAERLSDKRAVRGGAQARGLTRASMSMDRTDKGAHCGCRINK